MIDAEAEELGNDRIISRITKFGAEIVGITSTTVAFHRAIELAKGIRDYDKGLPIVLGGPHVTALPEHALSFDCFDVGVLGEGEITFLELVQTLKNSHELRAVDGIVFRENSKLHFTKPREYISNLDELPFPARHLLPDINYYLPPPMNYRHVPVVNMITTRGCPYRCIFCDKNVFGQKYRKHSPEYVVSEIEHVIDTFGAREIAFVDDTFTVDKKRVEQIIELINKRDIHIDWSCMGRVNTVTRDLLEKMKDAGCWHISYGIESGNQKVLAFIKKGITVDQVRSAIKWSDEVGIHSKGFFMLGHLTDSEETIGETISFAKSLPLTDVVVTLNTPIPNTEQYSLAEHYGRLDTHDWSRFSYWHPVFVPHHLSEKYLIEAQRKFFRQFYFRPQIIIRHLRQIRSITDIRRYIRGIKSLKAMIGWKWKKNDL